LFGWEQWQGLEERFGSVVGMDGRQSNDGNNDVTAGRMGRRNGRWMRHEPVVTGHFMYGTRHASLAIAMEHVSWRSFLC